MEKYALTPAEFAEMRGAIGDIGAQAHVQCAGQQP
jgi:hypothetical protein